MLKSLNVSAADVFRTTPIGSTDGAIGSVFYGINHRQTPSPIPINKDLFGLTFFTRPQLNMMTENLRAERRFIPLLTNRSDSIPRIIRTYLDPRLNNDSTPCAFVDPQMAFMPLLTNHLISMSGWPDMVVDSFTSKPGAYKEVYSMVDGTTDLYSAYSINATFRNMIGDPITLLFSTWLIYQSNVFQGIMVPYPDFLMKNEIDYNTRIYRLVLDNTKTYVQKIACCGAAYPTSVPMARAFDFESEKPLNESNNQIQIQFQCLGACYNDDIIVHEFNKTVSIFNQSITPSNFGYAVEKIPYAALQLLNGRGYPYINPNTYELEWYIPKEEYLRTVQAYTNYMNQL